ncbi:MAG: signal peptidase I [Verrucomicrobia bacterium]|nr:signal peptidase I [Verrucomicrobiota bacterium]
MTDPTTDHLRQKARRWTWYCPGAGYAIIGQGKPACAALAISFIAAICALSFALLPSEFTLKLFAVALLVAAVSWLIEYMSIGRVEIGQQPAPWWSRFGKVVLMFFGCLGLAILVSFVLNVGYMRLRGSGMMPTVLPGERFVFSKRLNQNDLERGKLVIFRTSTTSAWGQGGDVVVARLLALPGDRIAIEEDHYVVNERKASRLGRTGKLHPVVQIPSVPDSATVAPGSYFVVQDNPEQSYDSRVLSWAQLDKIIGTCPLLVSRRALGKALE